MPNGLVLMTALPPTKGHQALIQFALDHLSTFEYGTLFVLVSTRIKEPIPGKLRVQAIANQFNNNNTGINIQVIEHKDDNAPQNPNSEDDTTFWEYWKNTIEQHTGAFCDGSGQQPIKFVYASEQYGLNVAKSLNAQFIPYDLGRNLVQARGTIVRSDPWNYFNDIMDSFKPNIQLRVTVFGSESIGKTTFSKHLVAAEENALFVPEWARSYLETHPKGVDITEAKMEHIIRGQYASQTTAIGLGKRLVVQDTDLLTTIGYYRIFGQEAPELIHQLHKNADLYIFLHSNIPFEPDPLRYGGDHREGSDEFWENILQEFNCNYISIETNDPKQRVIQAQQAIAEFNASRFASLKAFVRET